MLHIRYYLYPIKSLVVHSKRLFRISFQYPISKGEAEMFILFCMVVIRKNKHAFGLYETAVRVKSVISSVASWCQSLTNG